MGNRAFNMLVVLFWLATMSWLLLVKVMPLLRTGDPPPAKSQLVEEQRDLPPVCWRLTWNESDIGWAATRVESLASGESDVWSRVEIQRQAFDEIPSVFKMILNTVLGQGVRFDLSMHNRTLLDANHRLLGFDSDVYLDHFEEPVFTVHGEVQGEDLKLELISSGEPLHEHVMKLGRSLVGDEFSPQPYMPGLYEGRTWTEQTFSPMPSPTSPDKVSSRIMEATVEGLESIVWGDEVVQAWLVVYRDAEAGSGKTSAPVGRMWVLRDGMVVRQEVSLLGSQMRFERLSELQAAPLAKQLEEDWYAQVDPSLLSGSTEALFESH